MRDGADQPTQLYGDAGLLSPRKRAADLPLADVAEGTACLVEEESRIYVFEGGVWQPVPARRP